MAGSLERPELLDVDFCFDPENVPQDPEDKAAAQLAKLVHAVRCLAVDGEEARMKRSGVDGPTYEPCVVPHCKYMKHLYLHVRKCRLDIGCTTRHCHSSKELIAHWKKCKSGHCLQCWRVVMANLLPPPLTEPEPEPESARVEPRPASPAGEPVPPRLRELLGPPHPCPWCGDEYTCYAFAGKPSPEELASRPASECCMRAFWGDRSAFERPTEESAREPGERPARFYQNVSRRLIDLETEPRLPSLDSSRQRMENMMQRMTQLSKLLESTLGIDVAEPPYPEPGARALHSHFDNVFANTRELRRQRAQRDFARYNAERRDRHIA